MRALLLAAGLFATFSAAAAAAPEPLTAQQIIGAHIVAAGGAPIGEVSDLLCDTRQDRIADFVVSHANVQVALPWTPLAEGKSAAIRISPALPAQSAPVGDTLDGNPALRAVEHDLVGRAVISADGMPAGHIVGLRIDPQSGAVTALLIVDAPGQTARELPWSAVADIGLSPIVLDINAQQVAALPTVGARVAAN